MAKKTYVNGEKITGGGYRNILDLSDEFDIGNNIDNGFLEILPWIEESNVNSVIYEIKRYISNAIEYDAYGVLKFAKYSNVTTLVLGFMHAHYNKLDADYISNNEFDKVTDYINFVFGINVDNATSNDITIEIKYFANSKKWGIRITEI